MGSNGWNNATNLLWLGDPKSFDVALVGGKAANLSRLARLYHRVPDGFSLPVTVTEAAHPLGLREEISSAVADPMRCHSLPDFVAAVRSSAVDEDGLAASFAGQHETDLNTVGAEGNHPGQRGEVLINASWGLGESIGGGTVTPDTLVVRGSDLAVIDRAIADKQPMTVAAPGGTREVAVPRCLRQAASLTDEQVVEIARLAQTLKTTLGHPVDVECAFAGGALYWLQCRPITTL